jgi:hypothetical protein
MAPKRRAEAASQGPFSRYERSWLRRDPRSDDGPVGLPGLLAALHSPLPHSVYIGAQLIRINAGTFGGKMVNGVGRMAQRRKLDRAGTEEAEMWRETCVRSPSRVRQTRPGEPIMM